MNITDQQLADLLQKAGKLDTEKLKAATDIATAKKLSFWDALVEADVASDEELGLLEASSINLPFIVLTKRTIAPEVIGILPQEVAKKQHAVVFERDDKRVKVALSNVSNTKILEVIVKKTGQAVEVYYATERDIENTIALYRKDLQRQFHKLLKDGLGSAVIGEDRDPPIERIVDLLLQAAYTEKASDVHIEPRENGTTIRFRIDGLLYDALQIPAELHNRVVTRIKVLSSLRTDEHMAAQDGKMQMDVTEEVLDMRVSIAPVSDGEKVVLRLLSSKSRSYSLTDLGYNERDLMTVTKAFNKPNGMILSTGPTGSGKTTSIYALLKILNTREMNITSIEDPVEYKIGGANQIQVNTKANLTFANGLRSILRQDPDYIFVGEIRDNETASIAVNAALTGHLVLSTVHTNDAPSTIPRLIDMQVEPFLVATTLNAIIAQRLIRKICDKCKVSYTLPFVDLHKHLEKETVKKHFIPVGEQKQVRLYKGNGCENCHFSGYQGRIGIFEVLDVTPEIREAITQKKDSDFIRTLAEEQGMTTMINDGLNKVARGFTTIEEVLRVTKVEG